jgi:hypothetical protein
MSAFDAKLLELLSHRPSHVTCTILLECEHVNPALALLIIDETFSKSTSSFLEKTVCRTAVEFTSGGEIFRCVGHKVTSKGFTSIMPWLAVGENILPTFKKGDTVSIHKVDIYEVSLMSLLTSPELAFSWMWDC